MKIEDPYVPQLRPGAAKYVVSFFFFFPQKRQRKGNNTKYTDEKPLI